MKKAQYEKITKDLEEGKIPLEIWLKETAQYHKAGTDKCPLCNASIIKDGVQGSSRTILICRDCKMKLRFIPVKKWSPAAKRKR
jgi:hypothetical protein